MLKRKPKVLTPEQAEEVRTKDFFRYDPARHNQIPFRPLYLG